MFERTERAWRKNVPSIEPDPSFFYLPMIRLLDNEKDVLDVVSPTSRRCLLREHRACYWRYLIHLASDSHVRQRRFVKAMSKFGDASELHRFFVARIRIECTLLRLAYYGVRHFVGAETEPVKISVCLDVILGDLRSVAAIPT